VGSGGKALLLSTITWTIACGDPPGFDVYGARVVVDSAAPFTQRADFPSRIEGTIETALSYWGGDWGDLAGRSITLTDAPYVSCGGKASSLGCFDGDVRLTTRDPGIGTFRCVEETVLVHEIGHAVIGDRIHQDPRWMQLEPVEAALSGRRGYTADGEVDCIIWPSVWRHPLGTP
jgi:hypothetical protein